jgi:H+-transporting ATPase
MTSQSHAHLDPPDPGERQQPAGSFSVPASAGLTGLSSREAAERLQQYGPNVVAEARTHPWLAALGKFWGPVPWMLELAILLELVLRKPLEAGIITALLLFNGAVSSMQEHRAQEALTLLRARLAILARVRRDGQWQQLPAPQLVPGDAIHLRVGDVIPADVRLVTGQLLLDQSALTGESLPVELDPGGTAYAGTTARRGEATGEVTATGSRTSFGKTAELVRTAKTASHLERIILQLVRALLGLDLVIIAAVVMDALLTHLPLEEMLPFALVLLIASVPMGLPPTFTLSAALGAVELSRRGVLVTRLSAIEEAAGMDVLCSDKTGTITQNQLRVAALQPSPSQTADDLLRLAAFACDEATQDPLDLAILAAARERGLEVALGARLAFIPFDPSTKRSEALLRKDAQIVRAIKGAPQVVAELAHAPWTQVAPAVEVLSAQGLRVLAVAAGTEPALQWVGLVAFHDPPRPESGRLVQSLQDLGVRVLLVTGDSEATARAVAQQVGIGVRAGCLDTLREGGQRDLEACDLFAGVFPEDKIHLVQALQRAHHVVGMTGDGVNDAPALKQAEVGIAVSTATDVAKAAASMVLTAAGLGNIVAAIETSRRIYQRLVTYTLNTSIRKILLPLFLGLSLLISGVFVATPTLLILLIFANDLVTMTITTDRVSPAPTPARWAIRPLVLTGLSLALLLLLLSFGVFWLGQSWLRLPLPQLQTMIFVWLVVSCQAAVYLVRERRHFWQSRPSRWLLLSTIADILLVSLLAVQGWLMAPISPLLIAVLLALSGLYLVGADTLKMALFRRYQVR